MTVFKNATPNTYAMEAISIMGLTDPLHGLAVAKLITDLRNYNIWNKMLAVYPFAGLTATTQGWNLKNLQNNPTGYYLQFGSVLGTGWIHSAAGATPNPTSGSYCDTSIIPSTHLTNNNVHFSIYTTNNQTGTVGFGAISDGGTKNLLSYLNTSAGRTEVVSKNSTASWVNTGVSRGLVTLNNTAGNNTAGYQNGVKKNTNIIADAGDLPSTKFYLGSINTDDTPGGTAAHTSATINFASLGSGLTDSDVRYLYLAVQAYQTLLNRAV